MPSHWLGVGADPDPLVRARELQRSWERLLAEGGLVPEFPPEAAAGLRPTIVESWRRSLATGLDPTDLLAPIEADESEVLERWFEHPLASLTHVLTEQLQKVAEESKSMVVVTDASGLVLHRVGDEWLKERAAEMHLVEGARYSEAADGTNGIGTALAADHAFQVFAFEHFNERHHQWVCSGAPVHDPVSGQVIGLIDLSSLWKNAHPQSLELVTTAARTMEQCLANARTDRDARLRRRYSDLMTRRTDLLVDRDGYMLDGAEPTQPTRFDIPEEGGEVVLHDGSIAVAEPIGHGEAYLLRQPNTRGVRSAPVEALERAEERAHELATEQAALRQVATLVARESSPDRLFAVVAEQVARIFDVPHVRLVRYEPEGSVVIGGFSEGDDEPFPIGSHWPLDSPGVTATVRQTGRPARVESYAHVTGEIAAVVRGAGMRSSVASPIVVTGRLWGAMVLLCPRAEPLPADTDARLMDFAELIATAIANAESRVAIGRLADEQAALRRVATLVARGAQPDEVCLAVSDEVGRLFGTELAAVGRFEADGRMLDVVGAGRMHERWELTDFLSATEVFRTGRSARTDAPQWESAEGETAERLRSLGIVSTAASPIVVEEELWGVMTLADTDEPLPPDTEERLEKFTDIVATAIANAESRAAIGRLADEQAALRRVATVVAQETSQPQVFDAIAREAVQLLRTDAVRIVRYDGESGVVLAGWGETKITPVGFRFPLDGDTVAARIFRQAEPARHDDYKELDDPIAESVRASGIRSVVGVPVLVEGRLWGAITTGMTREEPLPPDTESRLGEFTALMATAISNAEARAEVERLAEEQAALRRVATLVARDVPSEEIFSAVSEEVSRLVGSEAAVVVRFEDDERPAIVFVGVSDVDVVSPGTRWELEEGMAAAKVFRTGLSARSRAGELKPGPAVETVARLGIVSTVASPVTVEGRLWGAVVASSTEELPLDTEDRVKKFTELVATAISNAESVKARAVLTDEQAALRRVATLVAHGITPEEVFQAVAAEVGVLFGSDTGAIVRFEDDRTVTVVGAVTGPHEAGKRVTLDPGSAVDVVRETGRSARFDTDDPWAPDMPSLVQTLGIRSAVASPIVVEGELWGAITTASLDGPLPLGAERRLTQFTELVATAVANTQAREEVTMLADEQAALRRVAVLVAQQPSPSQVFSAVTEAVGLVLGADLAGLNVFEGDATTTIAGWSGDGGPIPPIGSRFSLHGDSVVARIFETGAPARIDSYAEAEGEAADVARSLRLRSTVGAPILVEGKLWGALVAGTRGLEPWAENAETRIAAFTELVATAIANAESRVAIGRLADEQAALRRVATLVARGAPPEEIFAAAVNEVASLLPVVSATMGRFEPDDTVTTVASWSTTEAAFPTGMRWPIKGENVAWIVLQTRRSARVDDFSDATDPIGIAAREAGYKSAVGSPIVVEGDLWGVMTATSGEGPLPPDTEARLASFTELVATAISNAESREARAVLTEEQAALRRVATLVAKGVPSAALFSAVSKEVARVFAPVEPSLLATVIRFDPGPEFVLVGASRPYEREPIGSRWEPKELYVSTHVLRTGESARVDDADLGAIGGPDADVLRLRGFLCQVGSPIVVEGRLWGAMTLNSKEALPPDTDQRLLNFTELVATAIANAESGEARAVLTDEQAALRRVATLVARDAASTEVFKAVATEVGKLLDTDITVVGRYDGDGYATAIGSWSESPEGVPVGTRSAIGGHNVLTIVAETGKPARVNEYDDASGEAAEIARRYGWRSSIAAPIVVEDRLWGVMLVATRRPEPFPAGVEERLAGFTDLISTALANAQAQNALERVAAEQATLRRVATLVAQGLRPEEIFGAVIEEVGRLFGTELTIVGRFQDDPPAFVAAALGNGMQGIEVGSHWKLDDPLAATHVFESGRSVRANESLRERSAALAETLARVGVVSTVASSVTVEGRLWGAVVVSSREELPGDTEERLEKFTELVATAVANAESRSELAASRRRIVTASDATRRKIERDLHDGTQQRLVSLGLALRAAEATVPPDRPDLQTDLSQIAAGLAGAVEDLQELSRGIHPAILSRGGLVPALRTLARRSAIPVELDISTDVHVPEPIEVAAYFVTSEALANATKHAEASHIEISLAHGKACLLLTIRDDGVGGADPARGSGLVGLTDRVEALGGSLDIESRPGAGTQITVRLPLELESVGPEEPGAAG